MNIITTEGSTQFIASDDDVFQFKIERLSPHEFSIYPKSNEHRPWYQIPGYRIILVPVSKVHPDPQPYIDYFLRERINNAKFAHVYKRYKIKDGQS